MSLTSRHSCILCALHIIIFLSHFSFHFYCTVSTKNNKIKHCSYAIHPLAIYEKRKKKERKICAQDKCGKWYHKKLNCTIMYAKYLFTCESVIPDNICICCVVRSARERGKSSRCTF
jgi:hypothetical protein